MALNSSTIKRWLVIGLLVSNLALGALSFFLLRELDVSYSQLVSQSVPVMTHLHEMTTTVMHAQRGLSLSSQAATRQEALNQLSRALRFERESADRRLRYQQTPDVINGASVDQEIETVARDYHELVGQFASLVQADRRAEAEKLRLGPLRTAADRYCDVIDIRVSQVEQRAEQISSDYSADTGIRSKVVLSLASWPVLGGLLLAVVMAGTVLALFIAVFTPRFGSGRHS